MFPKMLRRRGKRQLCSILLVSSARLDTQTQGMYIVKYLLLSIILHSTVICFAPGWALGCGRVAGLACPTSRVRPEFGPARMWVYPGPYSGLPESGYGYRRGVV